MYLSFPRVPYAPLSNKGLSPRNNTLLFHLARYLYSPRLLSFDLNGKRAFTKSHGNPFFSLLSSLPLLLENNRLDQLARQDERAIVFQVSSNHLPPPPLLDPVYLFRMNKKTNGKMGIGPFRSNMVFILINCYFLERRVSISRFDRRLSLAASTSASAMRSSHTYRKFATWYSP